MRHKPTVTQERGDRTGQRQKLEAFFRAHPQTLFNQETLAEACGADIGAVRSRISELAQDMTLEGQPQSYRDAQNVWHRGKKLWMFVPRPSAPLGRDAGTHVSGQRELFR